MDLQLREKDWLLRLATQNSAEAVCEWVVGKTVAQERAVEAGDYLGWKSWVILGGKLLN